MSVQDHRELVAALLAVEGVAGASVEPVGEGPGTLRLQLSPGTDEVKVAGAVNRLLRARFGLAVDADRVRVLDEPGPLLAVPPAPGPEPERQPEPGPEPEPAPEPESHGHEHRNNHEHNNHHERDREPERPAPGEVPEPAPAHEPTSAASYAQASPFRTAVSEPEGIAGRVESSLPEPEGAVVTGSGGAAYALHDPERPDVAVVRPGRLAIKRVELVSAGLGVAVTVSLGRGGRTVTGEAEGAATQSGVHRSVATATLRAVESVVEGQARFEVEHIELARTGADQTVLVVLTMVTGRSVQRLSGASVVREDVRQAVVRAVLDAVNRRMEPMLVSS